MMLYKVVFVATRAAGGVGAGQEQDGSRAGAAAVTKQKLKQIFTTYVETLTPAVWQAAGSRQQAGHMPHAACRFWMPLTFWQFLIKQTTINAFKLSADF